MSEEGYFRAQADTYFANPVSAGPWRQMALAGRAVTGLLGHVIEKRHLKGGFVPARFTVDLYDMVDFSPLTIETRVLRAGSRLHLVEAELFASGVSKAKASCQMIRHTEAPPGRVWSPPTWEVPAPETLADDPQRWKWHVRRITGEMGQFGPKQTWVKDFRSLVDGVPLTPFSRLACLVDFVSPLVHSGESGVGYINTDATLYLHRLPLDEWVGIEVTDHQATAGAAVGHARLYDLQGPIGFGACAALAQRMPAPRPDDIPSPPV